ncbi:MAG: type 4 pilus major pilin [Burkholderiaceae bacterium]|jgi:type IV pilus assembly protein PilA
MLSLQRNHRLSRSARQQGFSLIEISIVTAIVLLLAIVAIPSIGSYLVENKVPKVGEELARFVVQTKVNASAGGATPYSGIGTENLANMVGQSGVFSVSGSGAGTAVKHGLGTDGAVTVAETGSGAGFSITLSNVNNAACPGIASVMQRVADTMSVSPDAGAAVTLKDSTVTYNALSAEASCAKGDVNSFVFSIG